MHWPCTLHRLQVPPADPARWFSAVMDIGDQMYSPEKRLPELYRWALAPASQMHRGRRSSKRRLEQAAQAGQAVLE